MPTGGIGIVKPTDRSAFNLELFIYGFFLFAFISLLVVSFNRRLSDIDLIYRSTDPQVVLNLMHEYHAQYLYVGSIEYAKYAKLPSHVDLTRFAMFMQIIYNKDGVAIYKVK